MMKQATDTSVKSPFDAAGMWNLNAMTLDYGGPFYRAWLAGATRMQTEATDFWNDRFAKDMAALEKLGRCTDPAQALETQMQYAQEAMTDWYGEAQRMLKLAQETAVQVGVPAVSGGEPPVHAGP